jgi:hypothetical protein
MNSSYFETTRLLVCITCGTTGRRIDGSTAVSGTFVFICRLETWRLTSVMFLLIHVAFKIALNIDLLF